MLWIRLHLYVYKTAPGRLKRTSSGSGSRPNSRFTVMESSKFISFGQCLRDCAYFCCAVHRPFKLSISLNYTKMHFIQPFLKIDFDLDLFSTKLDFYIKRNDQRVRLKNLPRQNVVRIYPSKAKIF